MDCFSIIILAGGKSERMGTDKGLLYLNKQPVIKHIIDSFSPICNNIIISTNNINYHKFGLSIVEDKYKFCGPIAGIVEGLKKVKNNKVIILSCDSPFVKPDLINHLLNYKSEADILFTFNKRTHPFPGLYNKSIINKLESILEKGERKLQNLYKYFNVENINCNDFDKSNFVNFNTLNDIKNYANKT